MYSQKNMQHFEQKQNISRVFGPCNYSGWVEPTAEWKIMETSYKTSLVA